MKCEKNHIQCVPLNEPLKFFVVLFDMKKLKEKDHFEETSYDKQKKFFNNIYFKILNVTTYVVCVCVNCINENDTIRIERE